jgi:dTDP-4-amino-4,6-dideoxygalactose transaminase
MTTGEGGMAVTGSAKLRDKIKLLRLHGMSRDAWKRYMPGAYKHWDILRPGWKYNMADVQAALGLSQLKKVRSWWRRRNKLTKMYDSAISTIRGVRPLKDRPGDISARHLYVILVDRDAGISRDGVISELQRQGIGIGVHFRAVHLSRYYSEVLGFRRGMYPVAEDASERLLSLPLYPLMTDGDLERVVDVLGRVMARRRPR